MNWGYKILFVYLAFVAGIALLVVKSSNQKIDLVTTDYYAKELKYQERIDAIHNTTALSAPVTYEVVNDKMIISFPKEFADKKIAVSVMFYCPSDDSKDITKQYETSNATITADIPAAKKGAYELQINWKQDDKSYYFQDRLFL